MQTPLALVHFMEQTLTLKDPFCPLWQTLKSKVWKQKQRSFADSLEQVLFSGRTLTVSPGLALRRPVNLQLGWAHPLPSPLSCGFQAASLQTVLGRSRHAQT